jgi:Tachylectin/Papain family cysteine protease
MTETSVTNAVLAQAAPEMNAVESLSTFQTYLQLRNAQFQNAQQAPQPPRILDSVQAYSLAQYQTPFQNQNPRGTCWAFAAAAALEAAYKRQYGITLHLSEEYIFHTEKTVMVGDGQGNELPGPRETNCSYWDFQGASDVVIVMPAYAVPEARFAPYVPNVQTLKTNIPSAGALIVDGCTQEQIDAFEFSQAHIPTVARWNAKYQIATSKFVWSWGPGLSPGSDVVPPIIAEISNNREVVISMIVGHGGDDNLQASPAGIGGHVTLIVGFDNQAQTFLIKNSWFAPVNPETGLPTFSTLSYATARQYIQSAHCIMSITDPNKPIDVAAAWRGVWNMDHDGWHGKLVIRRVFNVEHYVAQLAGQPNTLNVQQNSVRLGSYYRDGLRHDVNGHLENGGSKIVFFIADGTDHVPSGQETGQRFEAYLFSRDFSNAAGQTTWNNTPFGVVLSRNATPGLPDSFMVSDWKGVWALSHDGWQGTLKIIGVTPTPAPGRANPAIVTYVAADGTELTASASLGNAQDSGDPHMLSLTIDFTAANHQVFTLFAHTHEKGVLSGTTTLDGATYGVKGFKLRPIYAIQSGGDLYWYLHEGRLQGNTTWTGPLKVGNGWQNFLQVFPGGDGILYAIQKDGTLLYYRHTGEFDGTAAFIGPTVVGNGWQNPKRVIGAGNGIIYAIEADGSLVWYRHDGRASGATQWTGPIKVGGGWGQFKRVFSGGDGILYAVTSDGELFWYWHYGYADGSVTWSEPKSVGTGWGQMLEVFSAEDGVIYAVESDGTLYQYVHLGRYDGSTNWIGAKKVGSGWNNFANILVS